MNKPTSTRLGQILLDKGLVTAEQLDIAVKEQQKRRQLLDPFDENLGVNSSLGEILIELGFIDRLQLRRGLNWQLMLRKMAIVMSFCAPLMTVSYGAAAAPRPTFTVNANSSSLAPKVTPTFTKTSSSASSAPAIFIDTQSEESSSSVALNPEIVPDSSSVASISSRASSVKSFASSSSKSSSVLSSISKSSVVSSISKSSAVSSKSPVDTVAPKMPGKITVVSALSDRVYLSWISASDNIGVMRYKIYRDQIQIDTVDGTENSYMDFNVAAGKTYLYGISAGDDSGNWSVVKSFFVETASIPQGSVVQVSSAASSSVVSISASSKSATVTPPLSSSASSVPKVVASSSSVAVSSSSSKAASSVVSSSSSSATTSSVVASSSSLAASSTSSAQSGNISNVVFKSWVVSGPVSFTWTAPDLRENGNDLNITEIGGYELRYRKTTDHEYTYITINDAWKNYYNFTWLDGTYIFEIAAFDKNGLYSTFVDLTPH